MIYLQLKYERNLEMKRIICIVISLLMLVLPVLSGCGNENAEEPVSENVVATVGDFELTMEDLEFYVMISGAVTSAQQEVGSEAGWEDAEMTDGRTAREYVIETALDGAHTNFAFRAKAKELGIFDSDEETAFVEEQIESNGGLEALTSYGYPESALRKYFASMGAFYAIAKTRCTEEEAKEVFKDYITAKHILFTFESDGTGDDDANTLKKAEDAYARAMAGENFEDLINELNEDTGEDPEAGYTFGEGEMVDEFYQASKALEIGEISEPVRTSYGYHVIKRYPLPDEGTETYDTYIENIRLNNGYNDITDDEIEEWKETYALNRVESAIDSLDLSQYTTNDNYVDAAAFDETEAE